MRYKNEVVVGAVVIASLIVLVIGAYWLSGRPWARAEMEISAVFRDVGQLRPGNPVVLRGVSVGRISTITLAETGEGVFVTMHVNPDIVMPTDPVVVLAPQSMFGDWQAQIASRPRFPDLEYTVSLTRPETLPGASLPDISELTAVAARIAGDIETLSRRVDLAFTDETALKIRQTADNIHEISQQLTGFVDQQLRVFQDVSGNVLTATGNIQGATASVERVMGQIEASIQEGEIQTVLANVREASDNLRLLSVQMQEATGGVPALLARADTTMITLGQTAGDVRIFMQGLGPQAAEIGPTIAEARLAIAALRRAAEQVENGDGTLGRLVEDPALYEETQAAIATMRRLMADIQANPARYIRNVRFF